VGFWGLGCPQRVLRTEINEPIGEEYHSSRKRALAEGFKKKVELYIHKIKLIINLQQNF